MMNRLFYEAFNSRHNYWNVKNILVRFATILVVLVLLGEVFPGLVDLFKFKWERTTAPPTVEQTQHEQPGAEKATQSSAQGVGAHQPTGPVYDLDAKRHRAQAEIDGTRDMIDRELGKHP